MDYAAQLAEEFHLKTPHVQNIIQLIDQGNTIPFIARYRKEMTGSCDDQVLRELAERLGYLRNLEGRRAEIRQSIDEQGQLTAGMAAALEKAGTLAELEDLYRPFRPKRRTRATVARERGLEPLADKLWQYRDTDGPLERVVRPFIDPARELPDGEAALAGALDILAERLADDAALRGRLRQLIHREGILRTEASGEADSVYRLYYDFSQPVSALPGHRILAINRGEREGYLKVRLEVEEAHAQALLCRRLPNVGAAARPLLERMCTDSWKRLIFPSLERELRSELTERADAQAIHTFGLNLRPLLMQPPLKDRVVLGFDPAYRTGCKLAVVDPTGRVLDTAVIYPTPPHNKTEEAKRVLTGLIRRHHVEVIALGNGTASKESEIFLAGLIRELPEPLSYAVVSEAGASVYSASKLGAAEFPDFDVSLRSAVSIARRLQDPLAELVKIDPKAIGVGQYQHDMPQARLGEALGGVVESCVNQVGVDVNTASPSLLGYIAGISGTVARNLCAYRDENGPFTARATLKKVKGLGPKAFEQCAGFLRIPGADNPLDNTAVHPESYAAAGKLLDLFGYRPEALARGGIPSLGRQAAAYGLARAAEACGIGVPTLEDIIAELQRPGRDIRDSLPQPVLRTDILSIEDLKPGMELSGTVRNVVDFGVFVDIGVHQDGLVHISRLSDRFVRHPSDCCQVGDVVTVWVLEVDVPKKRIALSMLDPSRPTPPAAGRTERRPR